MVTKGGDAIDSLSRRNERTRRIHREVIPLLHRWLTVCGGIAVLCLTAACGGAAAGPSHAKSSGSGAASACVPGAAAHGVILPAAQEPNAGVDQPAGACWAKIAATPIANVTFGTPPSGSSAAVRVAWSTKALYVLCSVHAWPLYAAAPASAWWQNDACEYYVSGSNSHSGAYGAHDGQIGLIYSGGLHAGPNSKVAVSALKGLTKVTPKEGYSTLLIVPWSALGVGKPAKGQSYQFDAAIDYGDASGKYVAQVTWTGSGLFSSTQQWGAIALH